ncbi:MAG: hypothetical protein GX942_08255 [Papillibacter sp.]|nr:hypothetical protein [Papillibacter sp.]
MPSTQTRDGSCIIEAALLIISRAAASRNVINMTFIYLFIYPTVSLYMAVAEAASLMYTMVVYVSET